MLIVNLCVDFNFNTHYMFFSVFAAFVVMIYSFDGNIVEDWSRFPMAQHKLYQMMLSSNVQVPILVSGDVHMAELLRRDCRQRQPYKTNSNMMYANYSASRMLLEVTVSGMYV
jgi:phosphodiesterase/alkaline phosphatase D-like protein